MTAADQERDAFRCNVCGLAPDEHPKCEACCEQGPEFGRLFWLLIDIAQWKLACETHGEAKLLASEIRETRAVLRRLECRMAEAGGDGDAMLQDELKRIWRRLNSYSRTVWGRHRDISGDPPTIGLAGRIR